MLNYQNKKLNIAAYISVLMIILILIVVVFIIYKYQVEGEAIPPFKISKMIVASTAKTEDLKLLDNIYTAEVLQSNDIKIAIEKNPEYKKEAIIKKIIINNIQIDSKQIKGDIEIYRPSMGEKSVILLFLNSSSFKLVSPASGDRSLISVLYRLRLVRLVSSASGVRSLI